jgi:hypothetical protein
MGGGGARYKDVEYTCVSDNMPPETDAPLTC